MGNAKFIYIKPNEGEEDDILNVKHNLVELVGIKKFKRSEALEAGRLIRIKTDYMTTSAMLADELLEEKQHSIEIDHALHMLYGAIVLENEYRQAKPKVTKASSKTAHSKFASSQFATAQFSAAPSATAKAVNPQEENEQNAMSRIEIVHLIQSDHKQQLIIDTISTEQDVRDMNIKDLLLKGLVDFKNAPNGAQEQIAITRIRASPLVNRKTIQMNIQLFL